MFDYQNITNEKREIIARNHKARNIARTLGHRAAAGYLRNRAVPLAHTLAILGFKSRG